MKQVAGSSTFTYSYQGLNILYEKNVTGSTTTVTKHFYAGGLQVGKMVGTGMYYLHQDALGNTRLVTTSTVTTKFSSNYVPYGNNYAMTGKEVFMYTGKPQDSATGLYYYGARFYDPSIGRFVSQDSFTGAQEDPMSLNRYIYCRDNPMRLVDSNGNVWIPPQVAQATPSNNWLGTTVSNWWNSLPPSEQTAVIVTIAVVATAATVGVLAPVVVPGAVAALGITASTTAVGTVTSLAVGASVGAGFGAASSLATGLYQGNANTGSVLGSAGIGAAGGALGAAAGVAWGPVSQLFANTAIGAGTTFANQQVNSYATTGKWAAITPASLAGVALGGAIGAGGSYFGSYLSTKFGPLWENTGRAAVVTTLATTIGTTTIPIATLIPMVTGLSRWVG